MSAGIVLANDFMGSRTLEPNWEELAKVWSRFEDRGSNLETLGKLEHYLESPVLYAGGGRGTHPHLLQTKGFKISVIDYSEAMAEAAKKNFGLEYLVEDIRTAKLRYSYGSVLCTTGVLDIMDEKTQETVLEKFFTHLNLNGSLLLFSFYKSRYLSELNHVLPCIEGNFLQNKVPLAFWLEADGELEEAFFNSEALFQMRRYYALYEAVQKELGCDKRETFEFLKQNLPDYDRLAVPEQMEQKLEAIGFMDIEVFYFEENSTLAFLAYKRTYGGKESASKIS